MQMEIVKEKLREIRMVKLKERLKEKLKRLEIEKDWRWEILMDLLMHLGFGKVKRMEKRSAKQRLMEIG